MSYLPPQQQQQQYAPPQPAQQPVDKRTGFAIAALVLGIVALVTCFVPVLGAVLGLAAAAFGVVALVQGQSKGFSITGIALGGVAIITSAVMTFVFALALLIAGAELRGIDPDSNLYQWLEEQDIEGWSDEEYWNDSDIFDEYDEPDIELDWGYDDGWEEELSERIGDAWGTMTREQHLAAHAADSFLEFTNDSRESLIELLEYSGFDARDAAVAIDLLEIDWNAQALERAKIYAEMDSMTDETLRDWLDENGFTDEEIEYAMNELPAS